MKKRTIIFMVFALLVTSNLFSAQEVVEEIVAIINDDIITRSQYEERHAMLYQMLRSQLQGEAFDKQYRQMRKTLLESMIRDLLLIQAAKEKGLDVSEQVKLTIENIKKENNIETDGQLIREFQRQGIDFNVWKNRVEEDLLRGSLIFSEVDRSIAIDDSEIIEYYKNHSDEFTEPSEYKLRAIYLSLEGRSEDELQLKREEINQRLASGEDMAVLAAQYSEGPEKESEGDLGSFKQGELEKTLEQAVEKLKQGETSPWIKIQNGWYLLRLEEKKESRLKSFEEAKKEIEDKIFREKRQKKLEEFLKTLQEKSYIKILNSNPLNF
jgi:parvulin-like peptidyl-prolyl isomerase